MTRKLIIVHKSCVMAAIGERPYKTIFGSLRQTQVANAAETKMVVHKILDGQIMGKELGYSKTQKLPAAGTRTEPTLCQHNPINIRQGANGRSKWFSCVDCTMRWERTPVPEQNEIPVPMDLMMFGGYATQTYLHVASRHPRCTERCRKTAKEAAHTAEPCSRQLSGFALFLEQNGPTLTLNPISPFDQIPVPDSSGEDFEEATESGS
jgi:hypothetical protein